MKTNEPFDHLQPILNLFDESYCQITSQQFPDIQNLSNAYTELSQINCQEKEYIFSIQDWDLLIELQLESIQMKKIRNESIESELISIKSDRKSKQMNIIKLRNLRKRKKELLNLDYSRHSRETG